MAKGALIGKGMTAEVFEWEQDKVLKLYYDRFTDEWIKKEVDIGRILTETGIHSPQVYDLIDVDGRTGVIFQRIFGKSMLQHVQEKPWMLCHYSAQLAALQNKIHSYTTDKLPSQKDKLKFIINNFSRLPADKASRISEYIDGLPEGNNVCHGDLHFNNIIMSDGGPVPIDWTNAYSGNPAGDAARTCMMILSPGMGSKKPDLFSVFSPYIKGLVHWTYLNEYINLSKISFQSIDEWILPAAAVKLRDKIPGEEKWLMDIIDTRLNRLT